MTQISDDYMRERLATASTFTVAILRHGPNYRRDGAEQIIWEHGRRNMSLQADGMMSIVCAVDDGSDLGGVAVLGTDRATAHDILAADPAVVAGVFEFSLHTCFSFPGDVLQPYPWPAGERAPAETADVEER